MDCDLSRKVPLSVLKGNLQPEVGLLATPLTGGTSGDMEALGGYLKEPIKQYEPVMHLNTAKPKTWS